jgi:hypothetical protein
MEFKAGSLENRLQRQLERAKEGETASGGNVLKI